jgi:hypothetical protein
MTTRKNVMSVFPFIDDGLELEDIERLLIESGLGKPSYYEWRSRSGCYFCFYQRKSEWIGLAEKHPALFESAIGYEQKRRYEATAGPNSYTWSLGESLEELFARRDSLRDATPRASESKLLLDIFDDDNDDEFCGSCHL